MTVPLTGADGGLIIDFVRARPRRRAIAAAATAAVIVPLTVASSAGPASAATDSRGPNGSQPVRHGAVVSPAVAHDTSPRFDHMPPVEMRLEHTQRFEPQAPPLPGPDLPDPSVQTTTATAAASVTTPSSFPGIGQGFVGPDGTFSVKYAPPDPNGDIGQDDYVEIVNSSIAVFDRSGTPLLGPVSTPTLFSGFGNGCATNDDGDGTVKYDKAANRWVITEFSVSTKPYLECVAVSETSDPLGAWHRYAFSYTDFPDYPKLGIWPDGYYVTFNTFGTSGHTFTGVENCVYDRSSMLAGLAANQQCFGPGTVTGTGLLPADLDGRAPPPTGTPNYQIQLANTSSLSLWKFHVDWIDTSQTSLTGPLTIPVDSFTQACAGTNPCIPQSGTTQKLDSLGDRAMYRLAYRNDGGTESLVFDHSVNANGVVGVRWYRILQPNGTPVVNQQGTYAPDTTYRWMGSAAADAAGDIAVGYSTSTSSTHPGIAFAIHATGTTTGQLQNETIIPTANNGSQTSVDRWGDYTSMSVDPVDDCTFWYANEYIPSTGSFNWRTQIGHFQVSGCSAPDVTASPSPASFPLTQNGSTSHETVTVTNNGSSTVSLGTPGVSGPDAAMFTAGLPSAASLAPGASATVDVGFTPDAESAFTASLDIPTSARLTTVSVALSGSGADPPGAPAIGTATAGNAQATVSFTAPSSDGGSAITGYTVTAHDLTSAARGGQTAAGPASPLTVTGLTNGDSYNFTVTATNAIGTGPGSATSNSVTPTAPAQTPGAPTGLTATASVGQVSLSWTAPSSNGGSTITGYNVYRSTASGNQGTFLASTTGVSSTSFADTTVAAGTTYFYVVTAVNTAGEGPASNQASATTPSVPGAPANVSATPGNTTVSLSWHAPSSNGGSTITGYDVYRSTTAGSKGSLIGTTPTTTSTSFTDTGRTNGVTYFYEVTAINAVGESAPSTQVSATPATVPDPPTALSATRGNQQVTLTWTPPSNNGGASITGYNVYRSTTSGAQGSLIGTTPTTTSTSFTDTGRINGTTYFYEVTAVNGAGESAPSTQVSATPEAVPDPPTGLTAQPGNGQVTLAWTAPVNSGGSAITGYNVYRSTASGAPSLIGTTPTTTGTSYTDTGLTNGTTYFYEVTAINALGEGSPSTQQSATPFTKATAPNGFTAAAGNQQVTLAWSVPSDNGGSAITGYHVYRSTSPGTQGGLVASPTTTTFTDTGLTNGTTYYYQVAAVNGAGDGALTSQQPATPMTVPSAPLGLGATAGKSVVTLSWSPPATNGGSAVTGYTVYRSTSAGSRGAAVATVGATGYTDTSVSNGTTYYYEVTATNAVGEGPASVQVSARPHGAPSVNLTGQPSPLTNSRTAVFSFTTSDPNGEPVTTTCRLDGLPVTTCSSGQTYTDLIDGAHTFVVSAADADGAGGTASYSWTVDATRPTVSLTSPRAPFTLGTIGIRWSGSDGDGSGIAFYDVRYRRASTTTRFGAWTSPASWLGRTSTFATRAESGGYTDCFSVRAHDRAGNVSAWSRQRCTAVPLDDRAFTPSAGWSRTTGAAYFRHTATSTRRLGATLIRRGMVADRVALVVTRCATCGTVRVFVRGRAIATVRLTAARLVRRTIIVLPRFALASGAVEIRVVSSGRVVQIDGVGVSRS